MGVRNGVGYEIVTYRGGALPWMILAVLVLLASKIGSHIRRKSLSYYQEFWLL